MAYRGSPTVVLLMLGLVSQPVLHSTHFLNGWIISTAADTGQSSNRAQPAGTSSIIGLVLNERHVPVARATVQAFAAPATTRDTQPRPTVPPLWTTMRASGSASTDDEGRFRISGLESGEYLVAAQPLPPMPSSESAQPAIYATTFYPSTVHDQQAGRVSASARVEATILIELVRVRGARVSGSVVSSSGRPVGGMSVRMYRRFGGFGSESGVAVVGASGTFEIPHVPPGWYRLNIGTRSRESKDEGGEFADELIEVQDRDLDDLALVLGPGASISGRVVVEAGTSVPSAVGLRVSATPTPEQYSASMPITATVADNWSFRMSGPSGSYQFSVSADRPPFVAATRIRVKGVETPAVDGVELEDGNQEVVLTIAPRESPKPIAEGTLSSAALVEQFKSEKFSFRQFAMAKEIVERHDTGVLPPLESWLTHEDRHVRGIVAFIFAGLGDARGFQVITDILTDRSDRPPGVITGGNWSLQAQIRSDRYYAAHLLGDLRDPRAVAILVPLLQDKEVNSIVPWALGEIGDRRAIGPLLDALDDASASVRVLAIYALETLRAREALPRLTSLLNDHRKSNFGAQVSVADAAKAAIAKLQ